MALLPEMLALPLMVAVPMLTANPAAFWIEPVRRPVPKLALKVPVSWLPAL